MCAAAIVWGCSGTISVTVAALLIAPNDLQARERLQMLQDWLQHVAAQREVTHYEIFRNFLFNVRKEETKKWSCSRPLRAPFCSISADGGTTRSGRREMKTVDIEVCLVDGTVHTVRARNTASIDNVLEAVGTPLFNPTP